MNSKKGTGISPSLYRSLFKDISQIYDDAMSDGNSNWNKATLYSNWKIGESIVTIEQKNQTRAGYGDRVLLQLSKDLNKKYGKGFSERNLAYMRTFFSMYDLGEIHSELTWSHYKLLLLVSDMEKRIGLEKKAIQSNLSVFEFKNVIRKTLKDQAPKTGVESADKPLKDRLKRPVMSLYTYRVLQKFSSDFAHSVQNLDLGFYIRMRTLDGIVKDKKDSQEGLVLSGLKIGSIVKIIKNSEGFLFEERTNPKELFTYKAFLEKIVDGDTLVVTIDLGFDIFIEERLRLRGLDAFELGTRQGAKAKKFLESKLKDLPFLIIKTHGSDKYGRYLVDIFYLENETNAQKIIEEGIFLNNEMLEKGLALPA
ncbi:MAG: DUF1016 N-terminal domain-containing protein [Leptospiraceae bacterium]|nr:DUF1016 N-terminal domain-containing protein [Leptospiraceae bacterium]